MDIRGAINKINPFSNTFQENRKVDDYILDQIDRNSIGAGDIETFIGDRNEKLSSLQNQPFGTGEAFEYKYASFDNFTTDKTTKIVLYREMARFPEISQALTMFANQAIVEDAQHRICTLDFTKELLVDDKAQIILKDEFEHYINVVFQARDNMYDLFVRFLIEAEVYVEYIVNDKQNGLIGYKTLPAHTMTANYDGNGNIINYTQRAPGKEPKLFERNQVGYCSWGTFGTSIWDVRGYLEDAVRTYNQLKALEDAIVVYRLVRAPERRIWNISVGRMTTPKAEEYLRKVIAKYKKSIVYDPESGKVDLTRNVQSLTEDFWFARREGDSTSVETLQSGMNLGEITDVDYFKNKLYNALKVPTSRFTPGSGGVYQNGMDLEREELDFTLYVERARNKFKKIVLNGFIEHIRLKYLDDSKLLKYINKRELFDLYFVPSTYFKQIREIETNNRKLTMINDNIALIRPDEDGGTQIFDQEFFLREMCNFSDDIISKLQQYNKKNKTKSKKTKDSNETPPIPMGGTDATMDAMSDLGADTTIPTEALPGEPTTPETPLGQTNMETPTEPQPEVDSLSPDQLPNEDGTTETPPEETETPKI